MPTEPITVELDVKALARFQKRVARYQGMPLAKRMQKGALEAARLLVAPVRTAAPKGPTGNLRRSIRAGSYRDMKSGLKTSLLSGSGVKTVLFGSDAFIASAYVGPSSRVAPHRHLVIRGHRIVTPGGRDTGRRTTGNPFVDSAAAPRAAEAMRVVSRAIFGEG